MFIPFKKTFQRRGMRRVLIPFTLGLVMIGFAACSMVGA